MTPGQWPPSGPGREVPRPLAYVLRQWLTEEGAPDAGPPAGAWTAAESRSAGPGSRLGRLRILIIEDNVDFADALQVVLELFGHEARVAYTGLAGVEQALRDPPDVIVCDLGLPEMDGLEVARALRQNPSTARVNLIAVTGYGSDEDRRRTTECGFDAHLVKPVEASEILAAVAARIGSREPH